MSCRYKENKSLIAWAYQKFVRQYRAYFLVYVFLKSISGMMVFLPPIFIGKAIDYAINKDIDKVVIALLIIMSVILANSAVSIFESKLDMKINCLVTNDIKQEILKKIVDMRMCNIQKIGRGEFISHIEEAEGVVQIFINIITLLFVDAVSFVFALGIMICISPILSLICILNIPAVVIVQKFFGKKIGNKEKELRLVSDSYYSFMYEVIDAVKEIKLFNLQNKVCMEYGEKLNHATKLAKDKSDISIMSGFFSVAINGLFQLIMLASGCCFIMFGIISVGKYFTFNSYVSRFNAELQNLSQFYMKRNMYLISIARLHDLLFLQSENGLYTTDDGHGAWHGGSIRLENLVFSYSEKEKGILYIKDFVFEENQISVIMGKNGAGKSTLFDLFTGLYLFKGSIYIGNFDIFSLPLGQLRKIICYIQQNPYFFNRTITENLRLGNAEISSDEIENACRRVGMDGYIQNLPNKYDTVMNEDGTNFSGGQLQRLALARAILSNAPIILLDEITSGIDRQGKYNLYRAIKNLQPDHTVIIISHDDDIYTIADRVVYLAEGDLRELPSAREEA